MDDDPSDPPPLPETWKCLPGVVDITSSTTDPASPSEEHRADPHRATLTSQFDPAPGRQVRRLSHEANYFRLQHELDFLQDSDAVPRGRRGDPQRHRTSQHALPRQLSSVAEEEPLHLRGWWSGIWERGKAGKRESELRCIHGRRDVPRGAHGGAAEGLVREAGTLARERRVSGDVLHRAPGPGCGIVEGPRALTRAQNLPAERARRGQAAANALLHAAAAGLLP